MTADFVQSNSSVKLHSAGRKNVLIFRLPLWNLLCIYHVHLQSDGVFSRQDLYCTHSVARNDSLHEHCLHSSPKLALLYHEFVHSVNLGCKSGVYVVFFVKTNKKWM